MMATLSIRTNRHMHGIVDPDQTASEGQSYVRSMAR